jgi:transcriptional regulator with GAF, ATPase, and Fis domain
MGEDLPPTDPKRIAFEAVALVFGSLGRVCLALDAGYRIRHVSPRLDQLLGEGAVARHLGQPVEQLLGPGLFGASGSIRQALEAGERREGWRAWLRAEPTGSRLVSISAAPLDGASHACDPEARYVVVLRPAEEDESTRGAAPTAFSGVITRSRAMVRVLRLVEALQHSDVSVLVTGESGVGKGIIAQAIHANSLRRAGPFVAVNCAALPEALLESELFGHVRGAFTGAVRDRIGRFELASEGTILLDEIGELPTHLQAKLLRVIQDRAFERVGDSRSTCCNARVIAATHRDLRRAVAEGRFREDLYYRLRVFPIEIPPLRERREDVEPLARHLLARVGARTGRTLRLAPDALRALLEYDWPGNVRELENSLEYAATIARGQAVHTEHLPPEVLGAPPEPCNDPLPAAAAAPAPAAASPAAASPPAGLEQISQALSYRTPPREHLLVALNACRWRMADTSRALGISRSTLWRWMRGAGLVRTA